MTGRVARELAVGRGGPLALLEESEVIRLASAGILAIHARACEVCGNEFRVVPGDVHKALRRGNRPPRFCSRTCRSKAYRGEGNPNWRGGRRLRQDGYISVYAPDHPNAAGGYVMEHRLVVEQQIGRYLSAEEVVHHRNHVTIDNRPENLELMPSQGAHRRHHTIWLSFVCPNCAAPFQRPKHRVSGDQLSGLRRTFCSAACAGVVGAREVSERARVRRAAAA